MVQIANPIYDDVFKYLMQDNEAAKLLVSTIIDEEILELDFRPTETQVSLQDSITVFRIDFKALIREKNGAEKLVVIEIQKAKLHTDIMRFRRYLGEQYMSKDNAKVTKITKAKVIYKKAYPIISIYFLGHPLEHLQDIPVIKVARHYYNVSTGEIINQKEEFIESLPHDSYIIQIPFIPPHHSTDLEHLLSVFDQNNITNDKHILNIKEKDLPEHFRPILRQLLKAIADEKLRKQMQVEDDVVEELKAYTRTIAEQEKALEEKEQQLEEQNRIITKSILKFHALNMNAATIAETLEISIEQVNQVLSKIQ